MLKAILKVIGYFIGVTAILVVSALSVMPLGDHVLAGIGNPVKAILLVAIPVLFGCVLFITFMYFLHGRSFKNIVDTYGLKMNRLRTRQALSGLALGLGITLITAVIVVLVGGKSFSEIAGEYAAGTSTTIFAGLLAPLLGTALFYTYPPFTLRKEFPVIVAALLVSGAEIGWNLFSKHTMGDHGGIGAGTLLTTPVYDLLVVILMYYLVLDSKSLWTVVGCTIGLMPATLVLAKLTEDVLRPLEFWQNFFTVNYAYSIALLIGLTVWFKFRRRVLTE